MTKTSHSQPLQRTTTSLQPWVRDRYAALRAEAGPRLQQTRAVVVPVIVDASHKVRDELVPRVRDEYVPVAVQMSARVAGEAMHRSAPLRSGLTDRATATFAAARDQLTAAQLGQLGQLSQLKRSPQNRGKAKAQAQNHNGHPHRKLWFIGAAAAAGAALGTAAVLWQRSRYQAWVEDDATQNAMADAPKPERPNSAANAKSSGTDAHTPSSAQHEDEQQ